MSDAAIASTRDLARRADVAARKLTVHAVPVLAAGDGVTRNFFRVPLNHPTPVLITELELMPHSALTASAVDFATFFVEAFDPNALVPTRLIGTLDTKTKGWTAGKPIPIELQRPLVSPGQSVRLRLTKTGVGVIVSCDLHLHHNYEAR